MWWFRKRKQVLFDYTRDIHSHILPGVDDGVRTYGEAIAILKELSELGASDEYFSCLFPYPDERAGKSSSLVGKSSGWFAKGGG